jgi:hypothetical protein
MLPFADNFLAGSLLTLLLPTGVVIAITIWYLISVRRIPGGEPRTVVPDPVAPVDEEPPPRGEA